MMAGRMVSQLYGRVPPGLAARLLLVPVLLTIADFSVTLYFQPEEYWEGDRSAVVEANPIARWVLLMHPLLMIPAMLAWYVLIFPLIFRTPARFGLRVVVLHVLGHFIAISGWLIRMTENGVLSAMLLFAFTALLVWRILGPFRGQWNSSRPVRSLYS